MKFVDFKVCFQEVPDEISLCINLSGCPHRCRGCHSSYLQQDIGKVLTTQVLDKLIESSDGITCVCFMGGDNDILSLHTLAQHVKQHHHLLTAWYTGNSFRPTIDRPICQVFDFIKTGPYIESLGPLNNPNTNQRFYTKGTDNTWHNTTNKFWKEDDKDS